MSVLLIVELKCTLAASQQHVSHGEYADGTYRKTDGRTKRNNIRIVCASILAGY